MNFKSIFLAIAVLLSFNIYAQVGINTETPDSSSALDIKSADKGVLLPRMTHTESATIQNPANGLLIFNTDCNAFQFNAGTSAKPKWRSMEPHNCPVSLDAELVCSTLKVNGEYYKGNTTDGNSNTVEVTIKILELSTNPEENKYNISTGEINGYSFSGNGEFTQKGEQTITLKASGTPTEKQTDTFTIDLNGSTCNFDVEVKGPITIVGSPNYGSSIGSGSPAYFEQGQDWGYGVNSGNSWSAMIYNKNWIESTGNINKISFLIDHNVSKGCESTTPNQKVYMKLVDNSSFSNGKNEDPSSMEKVFSGSVTWRIKKYDGTNTQLWSEVTLDKPFNFDGTKNLLIYFVNEYGGATECLGGRYGGPSFIVDSNGTSSRTTISKYAKYGPGKPQPQEANITSNQVPVLKVDFE